MQRAKIVCLVLLVGFIAAGVQAKVPKLVLGEADGLPVECEVCGYDVETGLVKMRAGDKCGSKPFDSFSIQTRGKILVWSGDIVFESSALLKISVREQVETTKKKNGKVESVTYLIVLENRSPFEMKNLSLASRVFYESFHKKIYRGDGITFSSSSGDNEERSYNRSSCGKVLFSLAPNEAKVFETSPVKIRDLKSANLYDVVNKDTLLGILCTLKKDAWDGRNLTREVDAGRVPREKNREKYGAMPGGAVLEKTIQN